ncbi:MAG: hypothetical protein ABJN26_23580 [Stappiaceae bacterium]
MTHSAEEFQSPGVSRFHKGINRGRRRGYQENGIFETKKNLSDAVSTRVAFQTARQKY